MSVNGEDGPPAASRRRNLPADSSSFIGRRAELARLLGLQATCRLLSLVGPGGVGKTRLALRVGIRRWPTFRDGVWLVDVAPLTEPELVFQAVADTLGIGAQAHTPGVQTVVDALHDRQLLLIVDTCEHQPAACAELAQALLRGCPEVSLLTTGRQPLGLADEVVWRVPPLTLPPTGATLQRLQASEAMQLFVARAREVWPAFSLNADNAPVAARLCERLDGLPLGIELVAPRIATRGLDELAALVEGRLALDLDSRRGAPARQRTLRATLEWSAALLSPHQRLLLRRLAVFAGGWTSQAAEAVAADERLPATSVAAALDALVDKSLVLAAPTASGRRQRLLNVTRQYGLEQLAQRGEQSAVKQRHLAWSLALAERAAPEDLDPAHADRLEQEQDNVRAALSAAIEVGAVDSGLRLAVAAFPLFFFRNHHREGRAWLDRLLGLSTGATPPDTVASARVWRAQLLILQGEYAPAEVELWDVWERQPVSALGSVGAIALVMLGNIALWRGDVHRARAVFDQARAQLHARGNRLEDVAVHQLAVIAWQLGETVTARLLTRRLGAIARARPQPIAVARQRQLRGLLAAEARTVTVALRRLGEAERLQRRIRDDNGLMDSLIYRGQLLLAAGRPSSAHAAFVEAIRLANDAGERVRRLRAVEGIARVLGLSRPDQLVQFAAAAAAARVAMGASLWPRERALLDASLTTARLRLGAVAYAQARQTGGLLLESEMVAMAESAAPPAESGAPTTAVRLTEREREVLRLLADGASARQIAERLVISPATVRTHLDRAATKLGLHSRVRLATWALQTDSLGAW